MNTNTPFPRLLISCKEHTSIKTLKSMSMRILKSRLFVGVVSFFLGALLVFHGVKRKNTASKFFIVDAVGGFKLAAGVFPNRTEAA